MTLPEEYESAARQAHAGERAGGRASQRASEGSADASCDSGAVQAAAHAPATDVAKNVTARDDAESAGFSSSPPPAATALEKLPTRSVAAIIFLKPVLTSLPLAGSRSRIAIRTTVAVKSTALTMSTPSAIAGSARPVTSWKTSLQLVPLCGNRHGGASKKRNPIAPARALVARPSRRLAPRAYARAAHRAPAGASARRVSRLRPRAKASRARASGPDLGARSPTTSLRCAPRTRDCARPRAAAPCAPGKRPAAPLSGCSFWCAYSNSVRELNGSEQRDTERSAAGKGRGQNPTASRAGGTRLTTPHLAMPRGGPGERLREQDRLD